jgi:hypothetical protein
VIEWAKLNVDWSMRMKPGPVIALAVVLTSILTGSCRTIDSPASFLASEPFQPINARGESAVVASERDDLVRLGFQRDVAERILKYQHQVYVQSLGRPEAERRPVVTYRGVSLPPCNEVGCYDPTFRSGTFTTTAKSYTAPDICYALNYARAGSEGAAVLLEFQIPAFLTVLHSTTDRARDGKPAVGYDKVYSSDEDCVAMPDITEIMVPFTDAVFHDDRHYIRRFGVISSSRFFCEDPQPSGRERTQLRKSPRRVCWFAYADAFDSVTGKWIGTVP